MRGDPSIGGRVKRLRRRRGKSQAVLAGLIGKSASWLSKVERGERLIDRLSVLQDIARVLEVDIRELLEDSPTTGQSQPPRGTAPSSDDARRDLRTPAVQARGEVGPLETRPAGQPRTQPQSWPMSSPDAGASRPVRAQRSLPSPPARERRVGPRTIAGLECVTQGYRQLYHTTAGADLFAGVAQHAELAGRMLQGARKAKQPQRRRLAAAVSEIALLAGRILFFDLDDPAGTLPYYQVALETAEEAKDPALQACVLAHMSRLPATQGRTREALDFLEGARRKAALSGSSLLQAWVASVLAKTLACAGEVDGSVQALDQAEALLAEPGAEPDPVWLDYFDQSRLHGFRGFCLRVERPEAAQAALQQGLALLDPLATKERACLLADLAATYLPMKEIEEVCRIAGQSLTLLAETEYATGLQRISDLHGRLRAWEDLPEVRGLREQLLDLRVLQGRSNAWTVGR